VHKDISTQKSDINVKPLQQTEVNVSK